MNNADPTMNDNSPLPTATDTCLVAIAMASLEPPSPASSPEDKEDVSLSRNRSLFDEETDEENYKHGGGVHEFQANPPPGYTDLLSSRPIDRMIPDPPNKKSTCNFPSRYESTKENASSQCFKESSRPTQPQNVGASRPPLQPRTVLSTQTWDGFVRQGTRLKSLFDEAMNVAREKIIDEHHTRHATATVHENLESPKKKQRPMAPKFVAEYAQEQNAQIFHLKRQLQDAQVQAQALQAANEALREEADSKQKRLDRSLQALRQASSDSQRARADADAAEATSASLAQTLQALQTVIEETKQASAILHQEHQQVATMASALEATLLQKEVDMAKVKRELQRTQGSYDALQESKSQWSEERESLHRIVEQQKRELRDLKRQWEESCTMEKARKDRAEKVEQDLRESQTLLLEASQGQSQYEKTQALLEETISKLRQSNQDLHQQLTQSQTAARSENERLSDSLLQAEKHAQELRIENEANQETIQRLTQDKMSIEKQVAELRLRATLAERRLKELNQINGMVSPESAMNKSVATPSVAYNLPPLSSTATPSGDVSSGNVCSICLKSAFGIMKSCQCGNPDCPKRAHLSCVNRIQPGPSVSHPCTPAPRLPVILCNTASTIRSTCGQTTL